MWVQPLVYHFPTPYSLAGSKGAMVAEVWDALGGGGGGGGGRVEPKICKAFQ